MSLSIIVALWAPGFWTKEEEFKKKVWTALEKKKKKARRNPVI